MFEGDARFAGDGPVEVFRRWMEEARESEPSDPNAVALATVDAAGLPNVRVVLLKEIEDDGFVFFTNYESAKGREIAATGQAAFVCHWKSLRRQVRVRGPITREDGPLADAYYGSRPLESRLGAWASRQSRPLSSRQALIDEVERRRDELGDDPARPPFWGGYRLRPLEIELWAEGEFRLHDRFRFTRDGQAGTWMATRLNP